MLEKDLITCQQAAAILGRSPSTISRALAQGRLSYIDPEKKLLPSLWGSLSSLLVGQRTKHEKSFRSNEPEWPPQSAPVKQHCLDHSSTKPNAWFPLRLQSTKSHDARQEKKSRLEPVHLGHEPSQPTGCLRWRKQ